MALITQTVSVNPAFLREIKEDHHELRQLMHHTRAMFDRPQWMPAEMRHLVELLSKLRDQLAMHFSLEEAYGYFEDAIDTAPHLARRAEELRAQHATLYRSLSALAEQAEQAARADSDQDDVPELACNYRQFSAAFHQHESQESQLIVEAFHSDLGSGD